MKTSNLLLATGAVLVLGALAAHNSALRAEYRSGGYRNPLHHYVAQSVGGFDRVEVPAASLLSVSITAGPFRVYVHREDTAYVRVMQEGPRLRVAVNFPKGRKSLTPGGVHISCPRLRELRAGGTYTVAGQPRTNPALKHFGSGGELTVEGFTQDSLRLHQDHANTLILRANRLGYVQASTGHTPGTRPQLVLETSNRIAAADLTVGARGGLTMQNLRIPALRCHFGDSATATLSGASLREVGR